MMIAGGTLILLVGAITSTVLYTTRKSEELNSSPLTGVSDVVQRILERMPIIDGFEKLCIYLFTNTA